MGGNFKNYIKIRNYLKEMAEVFLKNTPKTGVQSSVETPVKTGIERCCFSSGEC